MIVQQANSKSAKSTIDYLDKSKEKRLAAKEVTEKAEVKSRFLFSSTGLTRKEEIIDHFKGLEQQTDRPNIKAKYLHMSISFDLKDKGKMDCHQAVSIVRRLIDKLYGKHVDYAIWEHTDKPHYHLHACVCKVKNDGSGTLINTSFNNTRASQLCRELEVEYQLTQVNSSRIGKRKDNKVVHAQMHRYKIEKATLWKKLDEIRLEVPSLARYISRCSAVGIDVKVRKNVITGENVGITYAIQVDNPLASFSIENASGVSQANPNRVIFSGKKLGPDYMLKSLEKVFAENNRIQNSVEAQRIVSVTRECMSKSLRLESFLELMENKGVKFQHSYNGDSTLSMSVARNGIELELNSAYFNDTDRRKMNDIVISHKNRIDTYSSILDHNQQLDRLRLLEREHLRIELEQDDREDEKNDRDNGLSLHL